MYAGHFAAGLALKAKVPSAPLTGLLIGIGLVDVVFGVLVLAGVEQIRSTPGVSPGFELTHIDWSHSLLAVVLWAGAYGALFWGRGRTVALTMATAVFSHFVLDWVMHPGDLALYPHSDLHFGFGLWRTLPVGWWFVELALVVACFAYYARRGRALGTFAGRRWGVLAVLLVLHASFSPWAQRVLTV